MSPPGSTTDTRNCANRTGNPSTNPRPGGSNDTRTTFSEDPFTSQRPRHPCTPHAATRSWSGSTDRTELRGRVARNDQPMRTCTRSGSTST